MLLNEIWSLMECVLQKICSLITYICLINNSITEPKQLKNITTNMSYKVNCNIYWDRKRHMFTRVIFRWYLYDIFNQEVLNTRQPRKWKNWQTYPKTRREEQKQRRRFSDPKNKLHHLHQIRLKEFALSLSPPMVSLIDVTQILSWHKLFWILSQHEVRYPCTVKRLVEASPFFLLLGTSLLESHFIHPCTEFPAYTTIRMFGRCPSLQNTPTYGCSWGIQSLQNTPTYGSM